jgi:hypothetical protein
MGLGHRARLAANFAGALLLVAAAQPVLHARILPVHAAGPFIVASPDLNLPHALESISGSGFQPLASVTCSITTTAGVTQLGTLTADGEGSVSGLLRLPFNLDAGIVNTITGTQSGGSSSASVQVTGVGVLPSIAAGQVLSGHIGDTLTVHALGFAPQDQLAVTIGGAPAMPAPGQSGYIAGDNGALQLSFVIPAGAPPGNDTLVVTGSATGQGQDDSTAAPINVAGLQNLVVTPNPAPTGSTVEIRAGGFGPHETVDLSFNYHDAISNGSTLANGSGSSDANGNLDIAFTLPQSAEPNTTATLTAHGESSGLSLSQTMSILGRPTIALVPPGAEPGTPIAIRGSGFRSGERVFMNSALLRLSSDGLIADTTGAFTGTFIVRALTAPGFYVVAATGINGSRTSANFTVPKSPTPRVDVSPPVVTPGDSLRVSGDRFLASEPVALSLNSIPFVLSDGPITATASGAFNTMVQVPKVRQSGTYAVTAQGLLTGSTGSSNVHVVLPPISRTYFAEGYTGTGPNTRFDESLDLLNTSPITAEGRIQYFLGTGITSTVTIAIPGRSRLTEDVGKDVGPNQTVSAEVDLDHPIIGTRTIARTSATGAPLASSISNGDSDLSKFWYFADGYTGVSFQEYLSLFNPGNVPAQIMVQTFAPVGTSPIAPFSQAIPAHARITINLRSLVPNRSIGVLVQSDQAIAAERVLYWGTGSGSGKYGTSVSAGIRGPAAVWTFPYASTSNGDQVFLSFANPTTVAAHVQFELFGDHGDLAPLPPSTIPPGARATLAVPAQSAPANKPIAIVARSDVPVVGEQAQYFGGSPNIGTHAGSIISGTSLPSLTSVFSGFNSKQFTSGDWYVLNTGTKAADLTAIQLDASGLATTFQRTALPGRLTKINLTPSNPPITDNSTIWTSDAPVSIVQDLHGTDTNSDAILAGVVESDVSVTPSAGKT